MELEVSDYQGLASDHFSGLWWGFECKAGIWDEGTEFPSQLKASQGDEDKVEGKTEKKRKG